MAFNKTQEKIALKFNLAMLDRTIIAVMTTVSNKKFISNVAKLFSILSKESYVTEYEKEYRVYLIRKMTSLILANNLTTKEELLSELNVDGKYSNDCVNILNLYCDSYLAPEELDNLDKMISNQLKYGIIENKIDDLINNVNVLKAEAYDDYNTEINKIENMISTLALDFREVQDSIDDSKYDLNLSDSALLTNKVQEIIDDENNPSAKIKTGLQMFNTMLGGGFEKGRLYCLMGVAKGFKSGLMLNCALWAKKYNTFKPKDPAKKPTIVYLTLENTVTETLRRIATYAFGDAFKFNTYKANDIVNMLAKSSVADQGGANIEILYRKNRSISAKDIDAILNGLEEKGEECVLLIVDYLSRLCPDRATKIGDMRLELSDITNDLCSLCKTRDIPIITGAQMNREAIRMIEDASTFDEKIAAAQRMGASQTAESINIVQNVDCAIVLNRIVNKKMSEDMQCEYEDAYLLLNLVAMRYAAPKISRFQVRFATNNHLRLLEDIYEEKPLSTTTIEDGINERLARERNNNTNKFVRRVN